MTLKRQVATGLLWTATAQIAGRGLSFLTMLILAKLLTPSLFGLVAMASLAIAALQHFQDVGFDAALVYRKSEVDAASHTAFWIVIASSLVVYLVAALSAPLVAAFFRQAEVIPILRVLALTIVLSSVGRVPYVLLSRDLDFRRKVLPELVANVGGSAASILLALRGYGVWSLVYGQLIRVGLATALVWLVTSWRPKFRFELRLARELFSYGKHVVGSQTLIFFITNVDDAVVGRYAGQAALGFYQFAYNLSNTPATQVTSILNQVMFPTFSRMEGDLRHIRARYYLTIVRYVSWVTFPMAAATVLFAPAFVQGLYGEVWASAIVPMQLLAVYGLIRSIAGNMGSIFRALGKPEWLTYIALWRLITMVVLLYPVTKQWGIVGVSALSAIVAAVDFVISATLVGRLVDAPFRAYWRIVWSPAVAATASALVALAVFSVLPFSKDAVNLLVAGVILVSLYGLLLWGIDRQAREALRAGSISLRRLTVERLTGR